MSPDLPAFQYHLGAVLAEIGDRERDIEHIERALALKRAFRAGGRRVDAGAALGELSRGRWMGPWRFVFPLQELGAARR